MRPRLDLALMIALVIAVPAAAEHSCDDPPVADMLTGESIVVDGLASEGHPAWYHWFITPPNEPTPSKPTSELIRHRLTLDRPGLWSIALEAVYEHEADGGGTWSSETCLTVRVASVVAAINLSSAQITTEEDLELDGHDSLWADGVNPSAEWTIDGLPFGGCNGGPPPASPADLGCTVEAGWLDPGWHSAGLRLTDPSSGEESFAEASFEVTEIVPLSVEFSWYPVEPDPGQYVHFTAVTTPTVSESDLVQVVWDFGDGTTHTSSTCPPFIGSCFEWQHSYDLDAWREVSVTVETADETATMSHVIEIGDPVEPPEAEFSANPESALLYQPVTFTFDGSCDGDCSWSWSFDDGSQSTVQSPVHDWAVPATYDVSLTVSNQSGSDNVQHSLPIDSCWSPASPVQTGACYGGPVVLDAAGGSAWRWSTGETAQDVAAPLGGTYWVNVDDGAGCWGHAVTTVVLSNCGDPGGDTNLDGVVDSADLAALIPELTDGDGDTVVGAGGGDLTAPGGDVTGEGLLRADDVLSVILALFGTAS